MRRKYGSPWWESVMFCSGPDGTCWEWGGSVNEHGYGQQRVSGKLVKTHRMAYEALRGPIQTGMSLDHLCRNPACCNPGHLEQVTHRENMARGVSTASTAIRTNVCVNGHQFTESNTYVRPTGGRTCRTCSVARTAKYRNKSKSEGLCE